MPVGGGVPRGPDTAAGRAGWSGRLPLSTPGRVPTRLAPHAGEGGRGPGGDSLLAGGRGVYPARVARKLERPLVQGVAEGGVLQECDGASTWMEGEQGKGPRSGRGGRAGGAHRPGPGAPGGSGGAGGVVGNGGPLSHGTPPPGQPLGGGLRRPSSIAGPALHPAPFPTPTGPRGAGGGGRSSAPPLPSGVTVNADGIHLHDLVRRVEGLPDPRHPWALHLLCGLRFTPGGAGSGASRGGPDGRLHPPGDRRFPPVQWS